MDLCPAQNCINAYLINPLTLKVTHHTAQPSLAETESKTSEAKDPRAEAESGRTRETGKAPANKNDAVRATGIANKIAILCIVLGIAMSTM
jgi:hypothetical protein